MTENCLPEDRSLSQRTAAIIARRGVRLALSLLGGLILALSALPMTSGVAPAQAETPPPLRYDISMLYDYAADTAEVDQKITYTNRTGATLPVIVLNAAPLSYRAMTVESASVQGKLVQPKISGVNIELPLDQPLKNGETLTMELSYSLRVPSGANLRFGHSSNITLLGNWHPTVELFWKGDFTRYPYVDTGDAFFTETAEYFVNLEVEKASPGLEIAHSGDLVATDGKTLKYHGQNIRDFAFALSDTFEKAETKVGETTITVFARPGVGFSARQMLEVGANTVRWANANLGTYPYSSLQIVDAPGPSGSGMEYPNVVFIGGVATGSDLTYVVAHEVLHQWLYGIVGNDEVTEPWLDEGPTTHLAYLFLKENYPSRYNAMWPSIEPVYNSAVARYGRMPLDSTIYDFPSDTEYFAQIYRGSALFLDGVRESMGTEAYLAMFKEYIATYGNRIAVSSDLLSLMIERGPSGTSARIGRYFSPELTLGAITKAKLTASPTELVVVEPR